MGKSIYKGSLGINAPFKENAIFQLIILTGVGYIVYEFTRVSMIVYGQAASNAYSFASNNLALNPQNYLTHFWTILTYGLIDVSFWHWLTNMIWLSVFSFVIQTLIGHKQVISLFIYGLLTGGIFCLVCVFFPTIHANNFIFGSTFGVMAIMSAALSLSPKFKVYLGEGLGIPLYLLAIIYILLSGLQFLHQPIYLMGIFGGVLAGYLYMKCLNNGYDLGKWIHQFFNYFSRKNDDDFEVKKTVFSKPLNTANDSIDAILDKISEKGINTLTAAEKKILKNAGH